jgi:hypothetical protein
VLPALDHSNEASVRANEVLDLTLDSQATVNHRSSHFQLRAVVLNNKKQPLPDKNTTTLHHFEAQEILNGSSTVMKRQLS